MIISSNPATGEELTRFAEHSAEELDHRMDQARASQRRWAQTPLEERVAALRRVAAVLREEKDGLAELATLEMGKPIAEARGEIDKSAWNFDYYADEGPGFLKDVVVASSASDSRILYEPVGLVLAVMPWNYPYWQVMRAAAPILVAGNGLILRHASNVPQCALAIESIFAKAGLPGGLVTTILTEASKVSGVIADSRIAAITFTGSTPVGRSIAAEAGKALKKQVLELGGSDPFVILSDADVEAATKVAVKARYQNTGQSCIAAKRFIVADAIADRFVDAFHAEVAQLVVGDPLDPQSTQGSMARASLRDELDAQVQASLQQGARLLIGGHVPAGSGAFYAPTILDHVTREMRVAKEETFGPVAAVIRVKSEEEAIAAANDTPFGLGAAIWTGDAERGRRLASALEAGAVFVNGMVASDPRLPFGGVKESGYGRELGSFGMHEFTNVKTVWTGPAKL